MTRKTLYGTLTHDEVLNENEKAMLYIKECAELVGLEVIDGKTAFSITFMAEVMKRLREKHESILDKIRAEIGQLTIIEGGDDYVRKMAELFSLKMKVLQIIDKYKAESEDEE